VVLVVVVVLVFVLVVVVVRVVEVVVIVVVPVYVVVTVLVVVVVVVVDVVVEVTIHGKTTPQPSQCVTAPKTLSPWSTAMATVLVVVTLVGFATASWSCFVLLGWCDVLPWALSLELFCAWWVLSLELLRT
jgi:hypothetical protein